MYLVRLCTEYKFLSLGAPYRVDLEVPGLSRLPDVNDDFLVVKAGFLQGNMCAVCPGAAVVGVEDDLWRCHCRGMTMVQGW